MPWSLLTWAFTAHPRAGGDGGRSEAGLTPARAGTAVARRRFSRALRAHPRAGGDGEVPVDAHVLPRGSPPRGRGRPSRGQDVGGGAGLTPARAGTAGEVVPPNAGHAGSPPRGRGRQAMDGVDHHRPGLTPARAGTARPMHPAGYVGRAHPRAGGDGFGGRSSGRRAGGSPPRGRGRHPVLEPLLHRGGLTPARAGTAWGIWSKPGTAGAHPRAGGDGRGRLGPTGGPRGSPPRGRGRHMDMVPPRNVGGLTPARAGTAPRLRARYRA